MKVVYIILIIFLIIKQSIATNGVDISDYLSISNAQCLKQNSYEFIIVRGYRSFGSIDVNAKQSILNSQKAGLTTDTYMFPCMGKVSPLDQVNSIVREIGDLAGTYWIDVEYNPSTGCEWQEPTDNCQFLQEIVQQLQKQQVKVGIYASKYQWQNIFGSDQACSKFSDLPLWYAHYDNLQSFSDFQPFAGWTQPEIKQYQGTTQVCGLGLDLDWY